MDRKYLQVEGHDDLVRDTESNAIVNKNRGAYLLAKQRAQNAQRQRPRKPNQMFPNTNELKAQTPFTTAQTRLNFLDSNNFILIVIIIMNIHYVRLVV